MSSKPEAVVEGMSALSLERKPVRVMVVFGTRPEAIKMAPIVKALQADPSFKCVVCSTGQHREMVGTLSSARLSSFFSSL